MVKPAAKLPIEREKLIFQRPGPGQGKVPSCSTKPEQYSVPKLPVTAVSQSNTGMLPIQENLTFPIVKFQLKNLGLCSVDANHLPITGRLQYFVKNWQVVTNDPWVLAGYFGVSHPLYKHTSPRYSPLSHSVCRGRNFDRQQIKRADSKVSNSYGFRTRLQHRICQQSVCNPQKRRWTKTSIQPPTIKSVYQVRSFQNGGHTYAQRPSETKRFHGKDRFERCQLYSSNLERP